MGAACGKGNALDKDEKKEPYSKPDDTGDSKKKKVPKSTSGSVSQPADSPKRHKSGKGHESDKEQYLEDEITPDKAMLAESAKGVGKVQFPEPANEKKFMDPDKATACYVDLIQCATIAAQTGQFYQRQAFNLMYGVKCCTCNLEIDNSPVTIMGLSFHDNSDCICCSECKTPLAGSKKSKHSDITVKDGKIFCDSCSVEEAEPSTTEGEADLWVAAIGRNWRHSDVKCCSCDTPLTNVKLGREGRMYCSACYLPNFGVSCSQCKQPIKGRGLQVSDNVYHMSCIMCNGCRRNICADEGVYLIEGKGPVHMDCSKSIHLNYLTEDEGILSGLDEPPSSEKKKHRSDQLTSVSSISTINSTMSRGFDNVKMPPGFDIKTASLYKDISYLRHDQEKRRSEQPTTKPPIVPSPTTVRSYSMVNPVVNGDGPPKTKPGVIQKANTADAKWMGNGVLSSPSGGGRKNPGKIADNSAAVPLAPVYYKKEREARKRAAEREKLLREMRSASGGGGGGGQTNGHHSDAQHSESEADGVSDLNTTTRSTRAGYDGDVSNRLDMSNTTDSELDSPVRRGGGGAFLLSNGRQSDVTSSDTEAEPLTPHGDVRMNSLNRKLKEGYVTEEEVENMKSGLGKEILYEMRKDYETKDEEEDPEHLPQDPIKASRAPDARNELLEKPLFVEIKYGGCLPSGINRAFDPWLIEQANKGPLSSAEQREFWREFHSFSRKQAPWRTSTTDNSVADGAMSDIGGYGGGGGAGGNASDNESTKYNSLRARSFATGYKSEGYNSSPELRRKMMRYNSLDMRQAWYNERFLTFVQRYHKKGHPLIDQQKEYAQSMRNSSGSLPRSAKLPIYPKERLMTNRNKKLPSDINRSRLELHLSDQEFADCFAMSQEQFMSLPAWKQNVLKQLNYLF